MDWAAAGAFVAALAAAIVSVINAYYTREAAQYASRKMEDLHADNQARLSQLLNKTAQVESILKDKDAGPLDPSTPPGRTPSR